jgi:hypothetical protein
MLTMNNILNEIKDVPVNRLEELYQMVRSLTSKAKSTDDNLRRKILSFGGAFSDMSGKDYADFVDQTKQIRKNNFERNIDL